MKIVQFFIIWAVSMLVSSVFAMNLGQVSGSWEPNGHWQSAGTFGVVCEERDSKQKFMKVKVYRWNGKSNLYEEYDQYRFWSEHKRCSQVTTADLQENFKGMTSFTEDKTFIADGGEKRTMRRWLLE